MKEWKLKKVIQILTACLAMIVVLNVSGISMKTMQTIDINKKESKTNRRDSNLQIESETRETISRILNEQIQTELPQIAITFDDGPKTSVTSRILDSLQANGGRATFFMLGSNVNANAGVIRRMVDQGCEVANHTHDHKYLTKIGAEGIVSQVGSTNQKIQAVCGVSPVLMRPPGGYIDGASLNVLGSMGMPAIMWSIDTRDWQHRNAQRTIDTVLSQVKDGDIILMHDIYSTTADAAVVLIPELTARGYQLVTVSELAAYRGGIVPGHKYSQFRP